MWANLNAYQTVILFRSGTRTFNCTMRTSQVFLFVEYLVANEWQTEDESIRPIDNNNDDNNNNSRRRDSAEACFTAEMYYYPPWRSRVGVKRSKSTP